MLDPLIVEVDMTKTMREAENCSLPGCIRIKGMAHSNGVRARMLEVVVKLQGLPCRLLKFPLL